VTLRKCIKKDLMTGKWFPKRVKKKLKTAIQKYINEIRCTILWFYWIVFLMKKLCNMTQLKYMNSYYKLPKEHCTCTTEEVKYVFTCSKLVCSVVTYYEGKNVYRLFIFTVARTKPRVSPTSLACGYKDNKRIYYLNQNTKPTKNWDSELQSTAAGKYYL
jgi:hypothetical protein